ncbi:MAG: TonB-dependent receptor [Burkholderiales bacterium]|uniref:TonB-dependent receptor plug domain-containing protein n=1 Tax=Inhella sp. TaxID=1921806 RepID=UPI001AD050D9|nr:TonB-dependent receptor [Burkholderiales bacterium]
MFKRKSVNVAALLALGAVAAGSAFAQQQPQTLERVEVTGSRLLKLSTDSPSPLQVLSSEDIRKSGATNIQELLLKNPALGTPGISRTNSNFSTASAGVATVDLRDLGADRTLVLVNGRRYVAGIPGSASVDLNTIPTDFIERVEILTGGASAAYGSDAVAGVVNIIFKKNFQGVTFSAEKGESQKGDDKKDKFSVSFGSNSGDGKATLMAHFGYSRQGAVYPKDRAGNEIDNIGEYNFTGDPADLYNFRAPFLSGFAPQGRFYFGGGVRTFDAAGNVITTSTNGSATRSPTGFNRQEFRTIAIPTERFLFATKGEVALAENHSAYIEGTYAQTGTRTRLEPFPLASGDILPASGGVIQAEHRVGNQIIRNPLVKDAVYNLLTDTDGDGLRDYSFDRRLSEVGNRGNVADRDTFRILTGVQGNITGSWDYDAYVSYGSTKESQVSSGQVNVLNFRNALNAIADINDIDGDGNTTEAICLDAEARAQGCVPINVLGFNTITPAMYDYVKAPSMLATFTTQKLAAATVRGELFELPAGPVGLAVGAEYREEYSRSEFDALQQAGLNAGNAIPRTEGKFSVKEFFAETRVPLLKGLPLVKQLDLTGTVRQGKYSTVGNANSWSAGLEWTVVSDLKVRASSALATRAPNINELYSPPSQTFPSVVDPCVGVTATSTTSVSAACRANPGVAANIAANGSFTLTQADLQGTSGFDAGNPNLKEEEGKTFTAGLVYAPKGIDFLKNFVFTADYFKVKIEDAIVPTPRQFILEQCYSGANTAMCAFITRRATNVGANSAGSLEFINSGVTNSGGLLMEGVDLTANWSGRVGPGNLSAKLSYTHLLDGYSIPLPGAAKDMIAGELGTPKDKWSLNMGYVWQNFGVSAQITGFADTYLDDQWRESNFPGEDKSKFKAPGKTYTDLNFSYSLGKATFSLGIDNAFDVKPLRMDTNALLPGGTTGAGTAADVYDAIGRRYYVGVRMNF